MHMGLPLAARITAQYLGLILLIILWKILDARNAMVFRKIDQTCTVTISNIIQDLTRWSHHFRTIETREAADL